MQESKSDNDPDHPAYSCLSYFNEPRPPPTAKKKAPPREEEGHPRPEREWGEKQEDGGGMNGGGGEEARGKGGTRPSPRWGHHRRLIRAGGIVMATVTTPKRGSLCGRSTSKTPTSMRLGTTSSWARPNFLKRTFKRSARARPRPPPPLPTKPANPSTKPQENPQPNDTAPCNPRNGPTSNQGTAELWGPKTGSKNV